ncbi:hypothetical protein PENTCL1PPCAC_11113 [Pristionchus entomophagus]|uniref:SXP/RAL-2 family protein Ani s 5-like cation-binding domain-containing protein n=1 Tax=Pristionchus entomophagus TaxID=358040 RepID=A0AAV5T0V2_9BILA|nr:hypothetical protein PENTCL1PPCAC_11113 [Pristionchus entomophagus]
MLFLCIIALLPLIHTQSETTVKIPKAETADEFIDRFNVIAEGIVEAVGVMGNCSAAIFENFVKSEKDATFANLKECVKDKVDFEKSFKTPLQNYKEQFRKLVDAEEAALNTKVNATRTTLKERAKKIRDKLEKFGQNFMNKLNSFGVSLKESDFVQGMKKAAEDMKDRVSHMFDKVKNFFGW